MSSPAPAATPSSPPDRSTSARLSDHARRVSPLSWKVLAVFLTLGVIGAGVYAAAWLHRPAPPSVAAVGAGTPAGASGLFGLAGPRDTAAEPASTAAAAVANDSWTGWGGAKGAALGFGFVGGFVIGFVFRAFLKVMALVAVVVGGGLAALSYYHVLNIDMTAAQHAYDSNAAWITDQATRLKDVLIAHLPSSGGGTAGVYFGLRRR